MSVPEDDPHGAEIVGDFEYDSIRDEWRPTEGQNRH
jgi:hypothetical protein